MDDGVNLTGDLLRMVGFMAMCVGMAWALQVLGLSGGDGTVFGQMMWVLGAASIAGAGMGAIYTASLLTDDDAVAGA